MPSGRGPGGHWITITWPPIEPPTGLLSLGFVARVAIAGYCPLVPFAWTSSRRRSLALLFAAVSFMGSRVESALPEVHDGHVSGRADVNPQPSARTSGTAQNAGVPSGPEHTDAPVHGGTHVDHCAHGHLATQPLTSTPIAEVNHGELPIGGTLRLVGFDRPPQIRPPIL